MKSYVSLITLLFSFVVFTPNWLVAAPSHGEVLRVVDGDTLSFQTQSGKKLRVRLADIEASAVADKHALDESSQKRMHV